MRRLAAAWLVVILVLGITTISGAQVTPSATVTIGTEIFQLDVRLEGKFFVIDSTTLFSSTLDASVQINAAADPDPFITYGFTATNLSGGDLFFGFDFEIPIVSTGPMVSVFASLSGGLTDATGNSVTITPATFPLVQHATGNTTLDLGVDVGPAQTSGPPPGSYVYGPFSATNTLPVTLTSLDVHTHFILSGDIDTASLTGLVNVEAVPEAGTLGQFVVLGTCSVLLGLKRYRRRT